MSLIQTIASWLYGHFKSFVVIVVILAVGHYFWGEFGELRTNAAEIARLAQRNGELSAFMAAKKEEAARRVQALEQAAADALQQRIRELDAQIAELGSRRRAPGALDVITGNVDAVKGAIELEMLRKERAYLNDVLAVRAAREKLRVGQAELERLRKEHAAAYAALGVNEHDEQRLRDSHPAAALMPGTRIWMQLQRLNQEHRVLYARNRAAHDAYQRQRKLLSLVKIPALPPFEQVAGEARTLLDPLDRRLAELDAQRQRNWITKLSHPVFQVIPAALLILLFIVLAPLLVKALLYFVVAPIASRRPAVTLLPDVSGMAGGVTPPAGADGSRTSVSAVSQPVPLKAGEELLVHAEYLQSTSDEGVKDTRWLLDWHYPLTSIASGMFALTRIRAIADETYTVSATRDPFSEVGLIVIPDGSAVVLQPHNLVGIVQRTDRPTRITRHWRLGSLNAWLTLQLRYLAFHGPTTLIAKGCRGIRLERADAGRSINQAATIGFSANLAYATRRCETFASYLMGKQELFNDNFSGGPGYLIYEEMPHFGQRTGLYGRGLQGIGDSVLKVFGV